MGYINVPDHYAPQVTWQNQDLNPGGLVPTMWCLQLSNKQCAVEGVVAGITTVIVIRSRE